MKFVILFLSICWALVLGGCADRSLMTDEEYEANKRPAPNSPDPMGYIPQPSNRPPGF
jgi:hypothetical protein